MKAPHHTRPRRPRVFIDRRAPERIAAAHADALVDRAVLRAQALTEFTSGKVGAAPRREAMPSTGDDEVAQRALFAAAIARAEFGRFYWSDKTADRRKPSRKASRNGRKS